MPKPSSPATLDAFLNEHAHVLADLRWEAVCARWGLSTESFGDSLRRSAQKRFGNEQPAAGEVEAYLRSLHPDDLALACACSEGIEAAWEFFIAHFREDLRGAARAIVRTSGSSDDARADDLADSLYAELYGIRSGADGQRKSLFEYFHGRSKLSTWLRAVLAQRHVDSVRTNGRTVSLEDDEEATPRDLAKRHDAGSPDPHRAKYLARIDAALSAALAGLGSRERMILACYYADQMRLAEIGKLLGEHESTVSRRLDRIRTALREGVTAALQREVPSRGGSPAEPPLDAAQVELAFEYATEDWPFDLARALSPRGPEEEPAGK